MRLLLALSFVMAAAPAFAGEPFTKIDTIIIDPGHGGEDAGARSGTVTERDLCFNLAQAVKELIEKESSGTTKVILTTTPDKTAPQRDRAYAANSNKGNVYISLHAASAFAQKPRGLGIYLPDFADGKAATWKEAGKKYAARSALLAERLKAALDGVNPGTAYFIGQAPLALFHGVAMPAVAVEAVDVKQPPAPETLAKIASAIYAALGEFDKKL